MTDQKQNHPFKRGTAVQFAGFTADNGKEFQKLPKTHIWAFLQFPDALRYIIEHPEGFDKKEFLNPQLGPDVVKYLTDNLTDGKKYLLTPAEDVVEIVKTPPPQNQQNQPPDLSQVS